MASEKIKGIVIWESNIQEFNKVFKVFTEDEILMIFAPGTQKSTSKNGRQIRTGNICELEIFRARIRGRFSHLKKLECFYNFDFQEPLNQLIYNDLFSFYNRMKSTNVEVYGSYFVASKYFAKIDNFKIKTYLINKTLSSFGLRPQFSKCVECGINSNLSDFKYYDGGFKCKLHIKKGISNEKLKAFYYLNQSLESYDKFASSIINENIFNELMAYIKENTFN